MCRKLIYLVYFVLVLGLIGNASGQTGQILIEWWTGITGGDLNNLLNDVNYPDNPTGSDFLTIFEVPDPGQKPPELADLTDNYGVRVRGYFHPPTTGDYTFWIISDDEGRLFLSPTGSEANKKLIARVIRNTGWDQWDKYIGQRSDPIRLEAGKKYYIEAIYKEGTGGDRLRVAYGGAGAQVVIPGSELSPWDPGIATNPSPADGGNVLASWTGLIWSAGPSAVEHHVYLGESYADVAAGTGGTDQGRQSAAILAIGLPGNPYPDGLTPGTTLYWRIDEVDGDGTIHTGEVWSLTVSPQTTSNPSPADGAMFVDQNVELSWVPGFNAVIHNVFFGTDETEVANGTGDTNKGPVGTPTYTPPGPLAPDTTYYWRIDEFDGTTTHTGVVWRFRTKPEILIRDPNLVGWWKMDDEDTDTVIDYSGYEHHGTLHGDPLPMFHAGVDGKALEIDARNNQYVTIDGYTGVLGSHAFSITAWIRTHDGAGEIVGWGSTASGATRVEFRTSSDRLRCESAGNVQGDTTLPNNEWLHTAVTVKEGATISYPDVKLYLNGIDDTRDTTDTSPLNMAAGNPVTIGRRHTSGRWLFGAIDDVRIYDKELTQEEIQQIMLRPDPFRAWDPNPADGSTPDIEQVAALSWSPGEIAAQHDVYFGTDANAVAAADTSDTIDIYRGPQDANSYIPPEGLEMDQIYYWRIDELNTDGTISTGRLWNFTVPNYLIVDDMESYTDDVGNRIFQTWIDGFGFTEPAPGNPGNSTGSTVGNTEAPFAEQTIVNNGSQSMPISYTNDGSTGQALYSETESEWAVPQDWTRHGVKSLAMWFQGYPASVSSFTEEPPGTYTLAVRSPGNIAGTSDEFLFAYKQLNGLGEIIAKVEWVRDADDNAQAGIMIRETFDPDSAHAAVLLETNDIAADADLRFRCRTATGQDSTTTTIDGIMAPQWLKLERFMGAFRAYYSTDGANWVEIGSSQTVSMAADVYVGLVVASENAGVTCEAEFSNVTITGTVTGQWQTRDIGINNNDPESVYVAIANSGYTPAVVYYEDPDEPDAIPTQFGGWTQWNIDLKQFADQGVNLAAVKKMFIGVGDRVSPKLGGAGKLFIDDIRLYAPICLANLLQPAADLSNNCIVDHPDLEIMTADWLKSDSIVSTVAPSDANLVAHYTLDGDASDSSGNNYHGIEMDGPTYVDGKFGQAIHLDGIDDYVAIQDMNYTGTGHPEVTVAAWIRTSESGDGQIASFDRSEFWRLEINGYGGGPGQVGWDVWTDAGQNDYGSVRRVDDGQWHHVAGVFDNGTMIIYIDGSAEQPFFSPDSTFGRDRYVRYGFLGSGSEASYPPPTGRANGAYFEGELDDVRIYSRALSQAEIAYLADETPGDGELYIAVPSAANLYDEEPLLSRSVNFKDIAVLVGQWLDEQLWPQP